MPYTEFYCNNVIGDNINAGSTTGTALITLTGGTWTSGGGVYFKAGADLSTITTGMFACVSRDGAPTGAYIARITGVNDDTDIVSLSTTSKSGMLTDGTDNTTLVVGGAWKGPNSGYNFPFNIITSGLTNADFHPPRVNLKNNATYSISSGIVHAGIGPVVFQGYTTTEGDGGKAIIYGGDYNITLMTINGANTDLIDIIVSDHGAAGGNGIFIGGVECNLVRCVASGIRFHGFSIGAATCLVECEAINCNRNNNVSTAGFNLFNFVTSTLIRCISHHNNRAGYRISSIGNTFIQCIASHNNGDGFYNLNNAGPVIFINCDAYNNVDDGFDIGNTLPCSFYIENCNAIKNGGYGFNFNNIGTKTGLLTNCGFGSGTQENTLGMYTTGIGAMYINDNIVYPSDVTPWVDPDAGDFRISLQATKNEGRSIFTQTSGGYSGTIGYPDIGAAQSIDIINKLVGPNGLIG